VILLDRADLAASEILHRLYGRSTANAVLAYKTKRAIINHAYQSHADNIVGKMTIASLDAEMVTYEGRFGARGEAAASPASTACTGGSPPPVGPEFQADSAQSYQEICRILVEDGRPSEVVSARAVTYDDNGRPLSGYLRYAICEKVLNVQVGTHFDQKYWSIAWPATMPRTPTPEWCGMFATWVWKEAALRVEWAFLEQAKNASNGPYRFGSPTRIKTSSVQTCASFVAPGDIIVQSPSPNHHMLVLSITADHSKADVIEGNFGTGGPSNTIVHGRSGSVGYTLSNASYFYSVDSYRWSSINYGSDTPGSRV